ncbi:ABC transporter permease [Yinghuangia seranimata]|uniref:ABC transporter permease n=1 Tax=Yinghuangia seranimata TaxID=408067 RepID=UPI00248B8721|nr:ABC transporter permease [Yinghuangia seranimata]MDI2129127.1 ABC transporter permease [Yinghuangia seranimata]
MSRALSPASAAILRTEARLFAREPVNMFWVLAFPTVLLAALGAIPAFREHKPELDGQSVIALYVPVCVLSALLVAGLQTMPPVLVGYREQGVLRRLALTPVRPRQLLVAQVAVNGGAALASALLAVVVGRVAFGVPLPGQPAGYLLALALATLTAFGIGAIICALSRTMKIAQGVASAFFFPMMGTAGLWLPVQVFPEPLRAIVDFTPFGAAAEALNQAGTGMWPSWSHLGVMAAWAVVLFAAAARWFRWE